MRYEYKYLVPNNLTDLLRERLLPYVELDSFSAKMPEKEYVVRSIYFDSSRLKYYHEKIEGTLKRKKVRIRGYNNQEDDSLVFLEIKRKYGVRSSKNRAPMLYKNLDEFAANPDIKAHIIKMPKFESCYEDAGKFLHHIYKRSLKPTALVVYDREAFYSKFDSSIRITFDKNLRGLVSPKFSELYDESRLKIAMHTHFVLEVKFDIGFPEWLREILQELHLSRQAVSKYAICLDNERNLNLHRQFRRFNFENPFNRNYSNMEC